MEQQCRPARKRHYNCGKDHPQWTGGRIHDKDGYVLVHLPSHPFSNRGGYVREHRLVMESMIGRYLHPQERVHHKNKVHSDNRPENLELFQNNQEHLRQELAGRCPQWSEQGKAAIRAALDMRKIHGLPSLRKKLSTPRIRTLHYNLGLPIHVVAAILGVNEKTVSAHMKRHGLKPSIKKTSSRLTRHGAILLLRNPKALESYALKNRQVAHHLKELSRKGTRTLSQTEYRQLLQRAFPHSKRLHGTAP